VQTTFAVRLFLAHRTFFMIGGIDQNYLFIHK
jgi:hypothetical protein